MKKNNKKMLYILLSIILLTVIIFSVFYLILKNGSFINNKSNITDEIQKNPIINIKDTTNVKVREGKKINTSKLLNEKHEFKFNDCKLVFNKIDLVADSNEGITTFTADFSSTKEIISTALNIVFLDKKGNVIHGYEINMENINANEIKQVVWKFPDDVSNAYDFKIEK